MSDKIWKIRIVYILLVAAIALTVSIFGFGGFCTPVYAAADNEPNNDRASAVPFVRREPINGRISHGDDIDWFVTEISAESRVELRFRHEQVPPLLCIGNPNFWLVTVYSEGGRLGYKRFSGLLTDDTLYFSAPKGKLYISITPENSYAYNYYYNIVVNWNCDKQHSYASNKTSERESTCSEQGRITHYCDFCDYSYSEELPLKDHEYEWTLERDSTCTLEGINAKKCIQCGNVAETVVLPLKEHDFEWKVMKEPTCRTEGEEKYVCTVCGYCSVTGTMGKVDHKLVERVSWEPSCESVGVSYLVCEYCDYSERKHYPALGHDYEVVSSVDPSPTSIGRIKYKCKNCFYSFEEENYGKIWVIPVCSLTGILFVVGFVNYLLAIKNCVKKRS